MNTPERIVDSIVAMAAVEDQVQAIRALASPRQGETASALIDLAQHPLLRGPARAAAAQALADSPRELAVDAVRALLHDEDSDVRVAAAYALGELGDTVDTGALVALLRDPERNTFMVARESILALGVLRDAESVSGLAHDRELSDDLRLEAVLALGSMLPHPSADEALRHLEVDCDSPHAIRDAASRAIRGPG